MLRWLATLGIALGAGCAHGARRGNGASARPAASWLDEAALLGEHVDATRLEILAQAPPEGRVVRLDHLVDLLDAARFAEDEYAREALWAALGGHAIGIGPDATREATGRLLQEALAIETAAAEVDAEVLDDDRRRFLTDAIMMLSVDLELPASAEGLSIRTLAYRTLVEQGHPRIVDNVRWRLYDHTRGTLEGAADAPARHRMDVAVQALYAEHEQVDAWLADTAPHARPPWPSPAELWSSLQRHREALASLPRWDRVIATRNEADEALRETVMTVLPAPRDPTWPMAEAPVGTGLEESLAPVVLVTPGELTVDAGRPRARTIPSTEDLGRLTEALRGALAQDGRGIVLLAADPLLPSPELHAAMEGLRQAQASRIELAVREPRLDDDEGTVVVALPLEVGRDTGGPLTHLSGSTLALLDARVTVHLTGRGPRFAIDGRVLSLEANTPRELETLARTLSRAYPREGIVRLTLDDDVMLQQLVDLLAALQGGPDRPFRAVGWHPAGHAPAEASRVAHDRILQLRADASWSSPRVELEQAYPLQADDQKRLEAFAPSLGACIPELEQPPPVSVRLDLVFEEGRLVETHAPSLRRIPKARVAALRSCIADLALPFRLRGHRDRVAIGVTLRAR